MLHNVSDLRGDKIAARDGEIGKLDQIYFDDDDWHVPSGEVIGYSIHAADGRIGHVEDLRVDDRNWAVSGLVVDTRDWLPGKKVLVPASAVDNIDWNTREVRLRMSREDVDRSCPAP